MFAVNVRGLFQVTRACAGMLRTAGGSVVNVASIVGLRPGPQPLAYAASKAAVVSLTRTLSRVLAPEVRVNAVAPGYIRTPRLEAGFRSGALDEEMMASNVPQRRLGRAEEVASVILFLASDAASHVTGQTIAVDGGQLLR